jgi:hypothetical protein
MTHRPLGSSGWVARLSRLILWGCVAIIAACFVILLASFVFAPALKRVVQNRAVAMLESEFASNVEFQSFEVTLWPRLHVTVRGLLIGNNPAHPLIEVATANAQSDLLLPWRIKTLVLEGLSLHIPTASIPNTHTGSPKQAWTVTVDQVVSEHSRVEILPSNPGQTPLHFELAHLRVKNFDPSRPAGFSAAIVSSAPKAEIDASGQLGPWNAYDPSATPLQGNYQMPHCDLSSLPGLQGLLSSMGRFQGSLRRFQIAGDADAAALSLSSSGHPEPFRASFQAALDTSNGSATIGQMAGTLQRSSFTASGVVRNIQDDGTRDIVFDLSMKQGRLEDLLPLAVNSQTSPISGALDVQAKLEILPGEQDILRRIRLDADFAATDARFSSLDLRERLRDASRKAQGQPNNDAAGSSLSSMRGRVQLNAGTALFSNLVFNLEGATAHLTGSYQLAGEKLDLHGEVWMDATLSQTATGVKALLLKVAEPFFRSKRGGSHVPIKITGTRSDPKFGVDLAK